MKKVKAKDFDAAFGRGEDVSKYIDRSKARRVNNMNDNQQLALFRGKNIRRIFHQNEWWFSVVDVCGALTDSADSGAYWRKLKQRLNTEGVQSVTFCHGLKLPADDGKFYTTDCANTEGIFRIIQSIPSPKAEPFKRWLAKVGFDRIQEIADPELATKRTRMLYKLKGYSDDWIEKRMRGIAIREELTDEWKSRGAKVNKEYEILTAEISRATFGVTPKEYKKIKTLKRENLRDHMDDFELIFTMLGERSTTEIHRQEDSKGFAKLKDDAKAGGEIAGGARRNLEKRLGRSIVSKENYLPPKRSQAKIAKTSDTKTKLTEPTISKPTILKPKTAKTKTTKKTDKE